jgi:16S rRNA (uracil1498-N3)-methyltransferase
VLKSQKFEWVLQKGTELGIVAFVPVVAQRCLVASLEEIGEEKRTRWRRIIVEAAEQSRRGRLPMLRPALMLRQAWEEAALGGTTLVAWEEEHAVGLRAILAGSEQKPFSINLFIGPEGGYTEQEIAQGQRYGAIPVSLGPRILRAETAGLVAAAAILYELGDLGS